MRRSCRSPATTGQFRSTVPTAVAGGRASPDVGWQAATGSYTPRRSASPLLAGRLFDEQRSARRSERSVICEARPYNAATSPVKAPVGKQIKTGSGNAESRRRRRQHSPRRPSRRSTHRHVLLQLSRAYPSQTTLFVKSEGRAPNEALGVDPQRGEVASRLKIVIADAHSLADVAAESVRSTKLVLWLLGVFADHRAQSSRSSASMASCPMSYASAHARSALASRSVPRVRTSSG